MDAGPPPAVARGNDWRRGANRGKLGLTPLTILISACLLGDEVRYDGGHRRDAALLEAFSPEVMWVRVCPEVEGGLAVPREPMNLVGDPARPRLIGTATGTDHAARLERFAAARLAALAALALSGFVCKSRSPSCGRAAVPVYDERGARVAAGAGIFTRLFRERYPDLPVADEGELQDPARRAAFLARARAVALRARRG